MILSSSHPHVNKLEAIREQVCDRISPKDEVNPVPRTYVRGFGALPFGEVRNIHPRTHVRGVLWYGVKIPSQFNLPAIGNVENKGGQVNPALFCVAAHFNAVLKLTQLDLIQ